MFDVVTQTLAAAVATNGTFTVAYPTGRGAGSYAKAYAHKMYLLGGERTAPADFTVAFGASSITVTWKGTTTIPLGTQVRLQFDRIGTYNGEDIVPATTKVNRVLAFLVDLGTPATADADGICASQSVTANVAATLDGAVGATLDVPRNVVAAWTNTAVCTVTGVDEYGVAVVEQSASGTSMTGKKAFKSITSVKFSANVTSATVGTGDVLGIPVFLPSSGFILKELEDGATATAGTTVAGVASVATATTGDVRGTYDPNSACDGSKGFQLIVAVPDPSDKGVTQYSV